MSKLKKEEESESLISETSLSLSLAPPRAPPHGTAHRHLYANVDPSQAAVIHHSQRHETRHHSQNRQTHGWLHNVLRKVYLDKADIKNTSNTKNSSNTTNNNNKNKMKQKHSPYHNHRPHHPHLSLNPESADQITRYVGSTLPLWWQNKYRDNGKFGAISDAIVTCSVPSLALLNTKVFLDFLYLSTQQAKIEIQYGSHPSQRIDLFLPNRFRRRHTSSSNKGSKSNNNDDDNDCDDINGFVFFVHGGAWGSGLPWMYRLTALPFLQKNIAVAIVGYRRFPDGNAQDQVNDLYTAAETLAIKYPILWRKPKQKECEYPNNNEKERYLGVILMGHSSGAHISMLLLIQLIEKKIQAFLNHQGEQTKNDDEDDVDVYNNDILFQFDSFVGLSGVYSISHHFDYEAMRGVEEISPMKPACGYTREAFHSYSPAMKLQSLLKYSGSSGDDGGRTKKWREGKIDSMVSKLMVPMLLVHGMDDDVVPFTSTSEAARIIKSCGAMHCSEYYLSKTGHADVIMHFMLGGRSADAVMEWLQRIHNGSGSGSAQLTSKADIEISSKL
mmetsp:Transcript_18307/g.20857  ORF Transcript_18307/g.20857 Transcript_18307/m.20857 type:complete len:557 (+) Transcript_18307:124-1794(+)